MRAIAFIMIAMVIGVFMGMWYASRERTCAVVNSTQGNVILCSNSYKSELTL